MPAQQWPNCSAGNSAATSSKHCGDAPLAHDVLEAHLQFTYTGYVQHRIALLSTTVYSDEFDKQVVQAAVTGAVHRALGLYALANLELHLFSAPVLCRVLWP